jgi:hypothetical protein
MRGTHLEPRYGPGCSVVAVMPHADKEGQRVYANTADARFAQ